MCVSAYAFGARVSKRIAQANKADHLRRSDTSTRFKRIILVYLSNVYAVLMLYLVLPGLVGTVFELYVGIPGRYGRTRDVAPVLHLWDAW